MRKYLTCWLLVGERGRRWSTRALRTISQGFPTDDVMASATSLLIVEDVVADKNDDSDILGDRDHAGQRRALHPRLHRDSRKADDGRPNWTVKVACRAGERRRQRVHPVHTVGGVSADAPHKLVSGKPATLPGRTRSRSMPRANTWDVNS